MISQDSLGSSCDLVHLLFGVASPGNSVTYEQSYAIRDALIDRKSL